MRERERGRETSSCNEGGVLHVLSLYALAWLMCCSTIVRVCVKACTCACMYVYRTYERVYAQRVLHNESNGLSFLSFAIRLRLTTARVSVCVRARARARACVCVCVCVCLVTVLSVSSLPTPRELPILARMRCKASQLIIACHNSHPPTKLDPGPIKLLFNVYLCVRVQCVCVCACFLIVGVWHCVCDCAPACVPILTSFTVRPCRSTSFAALPAFLCS